MGGGGGYKLQVGLLELVVVCPHIPTLTYNCMYTVRTIHAGPFVENACYNSTFGLLLYCYSTVLHMLQYCTDLYTP